MRSLKTISRRARVVELVLALSILTGCSSDKVISPSPIVGPPSTVDVVYCTGSQPTWVAFQDGDGRWTQAQPVQADGKTVFRHAFTANRAGVAVTRLFRNDLTALSIQYGAPEELAIVGDTNPSHCGPVISKTLLGTVSGLDTNDVAIISAGFGSRDLSFPAEGNSFALRGLVTGPQDILATRSTRVNNSQVLTSIILRRNPELPDSATLPVLDFNSAESFVPAVAHVTINGLGPEGASSHTQLRTRFSQNTITFLTSSPTAATRTYYAIPEEHLQRGDVQILSATANPTAAINSIRSASIFFRTPVDQTLTLGAPVTDPAFSTVATEPSLRVRAQFAQQADYDRLTGISFQQGQSTIVTVSMTATYASLATGYGLVVPDLSGVAGFTIGSLQLIT